jgi:DNA-binding transcriptional ArsR family regulator
MGDGWKVKDECEVKEIIEKSKQHLPFLAEERLLQERAEFFKALGDETRLRIVGMLMHADLCMCEITSGLQLPPSTVTHHLKLLERGNVVTVRKEGKFTIYRLNKELVFPYLVERREERV